MRQWWRRAAIGVSASVMILALPAAALAAECDEHDPSAPARSARITLGPGDLADEHGAEMRTFIATDSIGRVDVSVVSSTPRGIVRDVSAVPQISAWSPYYGERLKGIHVAVSLAGTRRPPRVVLDLRQVCAEHFRNTFLYH